VRGSGRVDIVVQSGAIVATTRGLFDCGPGYTSGGKVELYQTRVVTESPSEIQFTREIFAKVWVEVLGGTPLDDDLTWGEAGVDSLRSLQLLLRLEEVLQRNLSFDLFARELTPGDLIRGLTQPAAPLDKSEADVHTLFLVPGIYGDEPRLADFRRALSGPISCVTLMLPELDQPAQMLGDLRATARLLLKRINEEKPEGPISLAGYSFGGFVAYQLATELVAAGREVKLLCLLDPIPVKPEAFDKAAVAKYLPAEDTQEPALWTRLRRRPNETVSLYFERMLFRVLVEVRQLELARLFFNANRHNHRFERAPLRRRLLLALRTRAIRSWTPSPCDAPTLLIASEISNQLGLPRYWSALCPKTTVHPVSADHFTLFEPAPLAQIVPAILDALGLSAAPASAKTPILRSA